MSPRLIVQDRSVAAAQPSGLAAECGHDCHKQVTHLDLLIKANRTGLAIEKRKVKCGHQNLVAIRCKRFMFEESPSEREYLVDVP